MLKPTIILPLLVAAASSAAATDMELNMVGGTRGGANQLHNHNNHNNKMTTMNNMTHTIHVLNEYRKRAPSPETRDRKRLERQQRHKERKERVREKLKNMPPPDFEKFEQLNVQETIAKLQLGEEMEQNNKKNLTQTQRRASWFSGNGDGTVYNALMNGDLADPSQEWDMWAQGYRTLGAFIDCDHSWSDEKRRKRRNLGGEEDDQDSVGCSRWMMWASYVNPNYQGNGYYEYFADEPSSYLDCHRSDTEWLLMGVYRQEFYQYLEQISKHLWAIDDYEYIVARAGLMYMTDYDCYQVGYASDGYTPVYGGIQPQQYGRFEMALYSDEYCIYPDDSLGTYDDYVQQTEVDLGSKDEGDGEAEDLYDWWYGTQEYTLSMLNDVYAEYLYCTQCMDYPTYQDGYFIGDYGTDDDDIINQCWKFHSHDSFICEGDCIALGHQQGTITQINYGEHRFGNKLSEESGSASSSSGSSSSHKADALVESSWSRIMANAFLTFSFLLFVATFLAFAVARRSRYRESRSSRSKRLLDDNDNEGVANKSVAKSRRSSRSRKSNRTRGSSSNKGSRRDRSENDDRRGRSSSHRSRSDRGGGQDEEGDGLFRTSDRGDTRDARSSRSGRRKSKEARSSSGRDRSKSKGKSKSRERKNRDSSGGGGGGGGDDAGLDRNRSRSRSRGPPPDDF